MRLHFYFARKFAIALLGVFGVFAILLTLLDIVEQIRRFSDADISFGAAFELSLLSVPQTLYRILPLIVLLATLVLFLGLARSSELVVTRAAGRSALRALISPVAVSLLLGGLGIAVMNPIVAATQVRYEQKAADLEAGGGSVLSISGEGLWMRQGGSEGQTVIRAARASLDGTSFEGVTFIRFAPEGGDLQGPVQRIEAAAARLEPGRWVLENAKVWPLSGVPNPEAASSRAMEMELPSSLTLDQIRDSFGTPSAIPIWELPAFIANLESAGFSAKLHRVWMQMELALPLFLMAMVLVGAGFTMRHTRFGRTGLMLLLALMLGLGLYFIRNFAQILGENGQIPVGMAAWTPPIAGILASLALLLHMEDG
ncbi:LPS export ABC transporter permease LptG [Vannielia litorea]|uniref:Lipopolysaccharide export system permease protein n=1 Tax=Vannielia litorea TaxID=1217970 RepID=A0A1N6FRX6_9RHOB|nr:LPS export ABC transporter permease LptG [Vannielia litorea]SIN98086.1 lipopolysaccharide export system permease protein [Vannielia litorea]